MREYRILIGGELLSTDDTIDVINPATEEVIASSPVASATQLEQAVEQASRAFVCWGATPLQERAAALIKLADAVEMHADEFAEILTLEQGKPLAQARDEVMFSLLFARHFAENAELPVKLLLEDEAQRVEVHRKPLGVVAAICPWNFPLLITMYKLAPAVITGNTIIIKPAPTTPLSSLRLGELARDIFPPGVVNILSDSNNLGPAITSHAGIAKISFTGSTPTGKQIMANASDTLKRLTLELGGNDAAIVLDDVDPAAVAQSIFGAAFLNSGQVCIVIKRLYVHESIYDELCEEIARLAREAVVGNGLDASTQFGPVQNRQQYEKVCGYIEDAKASGRIIAGGEIPEGPGYFVPLTVVRDICDGARVVDEEPFGPVLPIIKYSAIPDAVERANASPFGLGGSVWSGSVERAQQVATQMHSGTVWINQHCAFGPHIPFPPAKQSGIGVEWSTEGLLEFTAMQVINICK